MYRPIPQEILDLEKVYGPYLLEGMPDRLPKDAPEEAKIALRKCYEWFWEDVLDANGELPAFIKFIVD